MSDCGQIEIYSWILFAFMVEIYVTGYKQLFLSKVNLAVCYSYITYNNFTQMSYYSRIAIYFQLEHFFCFLESF